LMDDHYQKASACTSEIPSYIDLLLSWYANPLDIGWFVQYQPILAGALFNNCNLHQLIYLYADPDLEAAQRDYLAGGLEKDNSYGNRIILELELLRGRWDSIRQVTMAEEDPELAALAAALLFLTGHGDNAIKDYQAALKLLRRQQGRRTAYFTGLAGIFYPLAIWRYGDDKLRAKLPALLVQIGKTRSYWRGFYSIFEQFVQFRQGDLPSRDALLDTDPPPPIVSGFNTADGRPWPLWYQPLLHRVLLPIVQYWVKADHCTTIPAADRSLYRHLVACGYRWPAAELARLFAAIEPDRAGEWDDSFLSGRGTSLAELFISRPFWDLALDKLSTLAGGGQDSPANGKTTRLIWLVRYNQRFDDFSIIPKLQNRNASGRWTKGRPVALKRLALERESFDCLSGQDVKLCERIKAYQQGWYQGNVTYGFDGTIGPELIGHPLLFLEDSPEVRVEVVGGEVALRVTKQRNGGGIKLAMDPLPDPDRNFNILQESPTRFKVVAFTADHRTIASLLGISGLQVPDSATDRVMQTMGDITGLVTVHSDIGGRGDAAQVAADATPRLHLLPLGPGLRATLVVRPFAVDGPCYPPGRGGETVFAEIDGKPMQARRDLKLERRLMEELIGCCPILSDQERDETGDWQLDHPEQCLELLCQLQDLPASEVLVEWPEGVKFRLAGQKDSRNLKLRLQRDHDWFGLQGELAIDEKTVLDIARLLDLLGSSQGRFLRLEDDRFLALTDEFRRRFDELRAIATVRGKTVRVNPLAALTLEDWQNEDGFSADQHWHNHLARMRDARDLQPQPPSTLQAELRDYQEEGYRWLTRLAHWGVGACLADDMGLGKTVQALALLVARAPEGPALVVAPTSVAMNWESETRRFTPTLTPRFLGNGDRQMLLDGLQPFDLLICSYGLLQQEKVAEMLAGVSFATVILDEAQAIKNIATRRSKGAMSLDAGFRLIMTGTPLENHLGELWNLFRFINPGLLGSLDQFNERFASPIERDGDATARRRLKRLIQPFLLRRTKTQVLQELPSRTEIPVLVELSDEEMAFYEALRRQSLDALENCEAGAGAKHLQILAAITRLRRACCNSRLLDDNLSIKSSKLEVFGSIVDDLLDNHHKALVFSQFVDHLQLIGAYLDSRDIRYQYLDGATPAKQRKQRIDAFQRGEGDLFLISLKAGGVGLNLTAADYVIHMDPWWNPAVEDQASDRAHRIGQQRPVTIYRLIAGATIEEKIVALHSYKRDLAESLLDGADISGKMSADELLGLMRGDGGDS